MNKFRALCLAFAAAMSMAANAGGILTNTNQNVNFLRNPARDAAIGIDGVYSNPAGVIFLGNGFHLSLNIQNAHQTRTVTTDFPLFVNNASQPGLSTHKYKGNADAPIIPSIQAAWNKDRLSLQFGFAITGGGGKCEFDNGLGMFEQIVSAIPAQVSGSVNALYQQLHAAGIPGMDGHQMGNKYDYNSFMRGRQYYYGFTLGAAYKINDNLSVYGGARLLYGSSNYYGYVKNIQVEHIDATGSQMVQATKHFSDLSSQFNYIAGQLEALGQTNSANSLKQAAAAMTTLSNSTQDIELNCDQTGWGIAPIIGIDYKTGKFNFAAKYEFKTKMRLKNKSANSLSYDMLAQDNPLLAKYQNGNKVPDDSPALLTVGAQYEITPSIRIMGGWHHYFDVDTKQFTREMLGDTNEYLFGAEWDINKYVQVSAGGQRTVYDFNDAGMNDISFTTSSYTYGLGVGVKVSEKVKINAAYFQTLYDDYDKVTEGSMKVRESYTRTNRVLGIGVDLKF